MNDILAVLVSLLLVGYTAMEYGRFKRAGAIGLESRWYRWLRLVGRVFMGVVVTGMAWIWAAWEELGHRLPDPMAIVLVCLGLLMLLLLLDLAGLAVQYRRDRRRREADFLSDVQKMIERKDGPGKDSICL